MMKKYSVRFLFLIAGLVLGLLIGRAGTIPVLANPNSQQPAELCDNNRGNPLDCLILLERQNSEKLIAIQEALNRQETSLTTINSNVTDLASASANSAEATLQALNQQQEDLEGFSMTQLRMQSAMDSMSKFLSTLANTMEKMDKTLKAILENLCTGDDC